MTNFNLPHLIVPDWPAPTSVKSVITTRCRGVSMPPFDYFNTAVHVGDNPDHVKKNRLALEQTVGLPIKYVDQVHGDHIQVLSQDCHQSDSLISADAIYTSQRRTVCAIQTADCLPVFLCNKAGTEVCVVHAGWRSLAMGLIAKSIKRFIASPDEILVYLGPAISSAHFEVGIDVIDAMTELAKREGWHQSIDFAVASQVDTTFHLDLYALAKQTCVHAGILKENIYGANDCTYTDSSSFYSYRRDGQCGRMSHLIWLDG